VIGDAGPEGGRDLCAVRRTYDRIADHFARTRRYPWPEVESFLAGDPVDEDTADDRRDDTHDGERGGDAGRTGLGVDVGCGNGRHLEPLLRRVDRAVGVDLSRGLLDVASERVTGEGIAERTTLVQATATRLPLAAGTVDCALYVATLHHLPSRERRVASLDELARVLAPGGRALVSAWSTEHDRFDRETGFDTTVDWTLPGGERIPRFYHVYDPAEFERELAASRVAVERSVVSSGNCYAVVR